MEKIKCITFDKSAQDSLPEHIKAKMKADREKARANSIISDLEKSRNFTGQNGAFSGIVSPESVDESKNTVSVQLQLNERFWFEEWNLQHVIWGFENGDYIWTE
jgi:hypothetical protein